MRTIHVPARHLVASTKAAVTIDPVLQLVTVQRDVIVMTATEKEIETETETETEIRNETASAIDNIARVNANGDNLLRPSTH